MTTLSYHFVDADWALVDGVLVRRIRGGTAMFTPHFNAFRFYDDDGGEDASTPLETQDTDHSFNVDADNSLQLRCRVDETAGADGSTMDDYELDYDKNGVGFVDLTTTDTGTGIRAVPAGLTDGNATTNRATDPISDPGAGSFVAGEQSADGMILDILLTASNFTEHVYGVEFVNANVANDDTFDFRISPPAAMVQNVVPRITIVITPPSAPIISLTMAPYVPTGR